MIADASTDLLAGKITPREFVSRVAYKSKPLVMTDLNSVNENKDELLFELLKDAKNVDDNNGEGAGAGAQAVAENRVCCVICTTSTDITVLFTQCKHLILCNDCYLSYVASQVADYDPDADPDNCPIICPSCRTVHLKSPIIAGLFTP